MGACMKIVDTLDWNLLRSFVAIAEEGGITKAAERLGRGQPAVSSALKRLEETLGQQLAQRNATHFELTETGKLLYEESRAILTSIERLSTLLADPTAELSGTVRITMASQMTSPLLIEALRRFHQKFPKASFDIKVLNSHDIQHGLHQGQFYFAICPVSYKREELEYTHLFKEHCSFYCGAGHRLFGVEGLEFQDLANERAIIYRPSSFSDQLQSLTELRQKARFAEPFVGVSENLEEVRRMIIAGLGVGAIPTHVAARDEKDGLLWRLPPYEPVMPLDIYLVVNHKMRPAPSEAAFVKLLQELVDMTPYALRVYPAGEAAG
ncbi:hypothetical protein TQ29_12500 [Actibacterium sp. EMB200-NS6]|nr:hypothetical protein TQ29_12500 [Actibacterium sp. EMB200-NS6]